MTAQIQFIDGVGYEQMMGVWSRLVGERFLDWLVPPPNAHWVDVGCGGGAFTELISQRTSPRGVIGIDPSESQLEYARNRLRPNSQSFAPVTPWRCLYPAAASMRQ